MSELTFFCMTATPFASDGSVDETAFRAFIARIIDARLGLYVGSGGSGEGHALSISELRRVYEIAVEECRGKVPVHANPPERHTVDATVEQLRAAADAGVEVVHMYTLAGWHGMKPTDEELIAYCDAVFAEVKCPIAFAVNPTMGYTPKASVVADICRKHPQIVAIKLTSVPDTYQIELKERLGDGMAFHVQVPAAMTGLLLGARAVFGSESNLVPQTFRRMQDLYEARDLDSLTEVYTQLRRVGQYVNRWGPSNPRWLKMAMKSLGLPGGEGGPRPPYRLPSPAEMQKFSEGLLALGIPEIDEQAKNAGLAGA